MTFQGVLLYLKKHYAIAASAFVVVACLAVYLVREGQITRLEADFDDLSIRRSRMLKNIRFGTDLPSELESLRALESEAKARLFDPEDLGANKVYFYQRESATGVKLPVLQQIVKDLPANQMNKKQRMTAARSQYQEIAYEVTVNGTYKQILDFMKELEGGPAFYRLDGLSVAPATSADSDGMASMRLGITILGKKK